LEALGGFPQALAEYDAAILQFPDHAELRLGRVHLTFDLSNAFW
jgi:hypothetical protein